MANTADIVKLAVDTYKGHVAGNYSVDDGMETLRQALIDANNGSTRLDYKAIRDGKCTGLFALIEQIIQKTVVDGLQGNEFFMNLVEYRNLALGDKNVFYTPATEDTYFIVSEVAPGTQGIRRQRLNGGSTFELNTTWKAIKIYEELDRVLSGRVDFNEFINRVSQSFTQKTIEDIYSAFTGITKTERFY